MELGKSKQWLERLEEIRKYVHPQVIHPGRGYAMNGEYLLVQQLKYLQFVKKTLMDFYTGGELTEQDKADIIKVIVNQYPDYGLEYFLNIGIPAEWEQFRLNDHNMM
jgi:hypothetical protein